MSLHITIYTRPRGDKEVIVCRNIYDDDADFFRTRSINVSMEADGNSGYIVYADYGARTEDGEPNEMIVMSNGRSCEDTLAELRQLTERAMVERPHHGI